MRTFRVLPYLALLAIVSCTQPVTPPVSQQAVGNVPDYFWRSTTSSMKLSDPGAVLQATLTFRDTGGLLQVSDPKAKPIYCVINSDSVYASNITQHSFLDLPDGSYFSKLDTEVLVPHKLRTASFFGSSILEIGTDTGVFERISQSSPYKFSGLGGRDIKIIAPYPDNYTVYAVTAGDSVFVRDLRWPPLTWENVDLFGLPFGHIAAFFSDSDQYAVIEGSKGAYMRSRDGGAWTMLDFLKDRHITAISAFHNNDQKGVILGTSDGWAGACDASSNPIGLMQQLHGTGGIHCFMNINGNTYAGTDSGLFANKTPGLISLWQQTPLPSSYGPITHLGYRAAGGIFFLSNGQVYSYVLSGIPTNIGPREYATTMVCATYIVGLTDTLAYGIGQTGGSWTVIPDGVRYYYPFVPGGLVMLRKDYFTNLVSWRAGTLVTYDHHSYSYIGRVMQHLDALQINGKQYPDVFVIRYAHELPADSVESRLVPYWVIYYQRGVGPIMFDKVSGANSGTLERRQILTP